MENWGMLSHLFVAVFLSNFAGHMVNPAITDVTVEAVCGGREECSLAIYLTGFQQAITGLGSVMMMPLIGNLSDGCGRKNLLLIPLTLAVLPLVILAWKRTNFFFYAYYAFKTLTGMVTQGGVICLSFAYLADNVSEGKRVSAFGMLSGLISAANVFGTLAACLLSTSHIFQVAAVVSIVTAVYVKVLLKEEETGCDDNANSLEQPILRPETERNATVSSESSENINFLRRIPSPRNIIRLLKSSTTFSLLASVSFFDSLAEAGIATYLMYYLKARFHFKKDQFAVIQLIINIGGAVSSMVFMPLLGPFIGEEALLILGLFVEFLSILLHSIAWSAWVPYASAYLAFLFALTTPSIRSLVSKQIGPNEQISCVGDFSRGIAQGCILGITAFANLVSPLIYSPLLALFLSEAAPFHFPGFSLFCIGLADLAGFILAIFIPYFSRYRVQSRNSMGP